MKRYIAMLLVLLMTLSAALALNACKKEETPHEEAQQDEPAEDAKDAPAEDAAVVTIIEPDAEDIKTANDEALQIESVILYEDGSIRLTPTDDLKKNELGDSEADSLMPFAESGVAKEIYLLRLGNGGYRTIVALMDDNTISAINPLALIQDHIAVVMDNLGGRDNFVGVEQGESEDGFTIIGKTKDGDEVLLDPVLLSDQARGEPDDSE